MALYGDTYETLKEKLGISTIQTISYKMNGKRQFNADEIGKIKEIYNLSDAEVNEIFFS